MNIGDVDCRLSGESAALSLASWRLPYHLLTSLWAVLFSSSRNDNSSKVGIALPSKGFL